MFPRNGVAWMWLALSACSGPDGDLPEAYRAMPVPEARLASDDARGRGRGLYVTHCAICHGVRADGAGPRSLSLSPRPADFTSREWRGKMTPRRAFASIREGRRGTPMAGWPSFSDDEVWDLVSYVLSVAGAGS